jgi:hypothetical protein
MFAVPAMLSRNRRINRELEETGIWRSSWLNRSGNSGGSNSQVEWSHDEQDNEQIQP